MRKKMADEKTEVKKQAITGFKIMKFDSRKARETEKLRIILEVDNYTNAKIEYDLTKPTMIPKRLINIDKAKKILNFEPKIDLRTGIKKTIEWYRNFCNNAF